MRNPLPERLEPDRRSGSLSAPGELREATRASGPPTRVLLVDNHEVLLLGLTTLFRSTAHIEVVAQARSGAQALLEAQRTRPDVVLLDLRLPDTSGVEVCRDIRSAVPETRVLMTIRDDGAGFDPAHVAQAGGRGLKNMAVRAAHLGGALTVESRPHRGTKIRLNLPVASDG